MSWPATLSRWASDVRGFHVGQRVVAANSAPCGDCFYCQRGQENLCEDLLFNNGAYAEYIRIPERIVQKNMYEIPAHVSYQDAALVEPLACVLRGLEETGVRAGDTVAVIGLGPIGMMFVRLAKAVYNARVIAIGRRPDAAGSRREMGADEVVVNSDGADVLRSGSRDDRRTRRGRRDRSGGLAGSLAARGQAAAARRRGELLRRLPQRHRHPVWIPACCITPS